MTADPQGARPLAIFDIDGVVADVRHRLHHLESRPKGWDEFFGYGRIDAYKAVQAAAQGWIPPEADITSPEWFQQLDPGQESFALNGSVNARSKYTCRVEVAPGAQPQLGQKLCATSVEFQR